MIGKWFFFDKNRYFEGILISCSLRFIRWDEVALFSGALS